MELHFSLARYCLQWSLPSSYTAPERYSRFSWPPLLFIYSGAPLLVKIFLYVVIGTIATLTIDMRIADIIYQYLGERELHEGVGRLDWDRPVSQYLARSALISWRPFQEQAWVTRPDGYTGLRHLPGGHDLPHLGGCVLQGWDRISFKCEVSSIPGCLSLLQFVGQMTLYPILNKGCS